MPEPSEIHILKDNPLEIGSDTPIPTPSGEDWTLSAVQIVEVEHEPTSVYYIWVRE